MTTTVVFGGGPIDSDAVEVALHGVGADLVIAADSGLAACVAAGLHCDLLVGDMDSVDPALLDAAAASGTVIERHEPDKDASDLELALDRATEGAHGGTVVLVASPGGVSTICWPQHWWSGRPGTRGSASMPTWVAHGCSPYTTDGASSPVPGRQPAFSPCTVLPEG
ncbi:MAG: hypothetical protein M5U19_09850 [Microthrixaceae bacterium]|nr:hypothetical protein [Microthrixaceae bacterium]